MQVPKTVEALLRGRVDRASLASGSPQLISGAQWLVVLFLAGAFYGLCMGLYGALRGTDYGGIHVLAVMVKVPALFLLTLLVTAPSLFVFASLARAELRFRQSVRLMLASSALSLIVLASFGPITAFFTFSTKSHPFMQLLNVTGFAIAGVIGVSFLARNLRAEVISGSSKRPQAIAAILRLWFLIYATVGLQMSWLLRPFVGSPDLPQQIFRPTEGNVIEGILQSLRYLF